MATEVKVPVLGESITEATLGEWLKQPGDAVAADEPIATLETDKVSVEVPSPVAGTMGPHAVAVGDTVQVGAMIATVEAGGAAAPAAPPRRRPKPLSRRARGDGGSGGTRHRGDAPAALSPSVRRAILEHGVDPASIKGTGKDGRITKEDVEAAAKTACAPAAAPAPAAQLRLSLQLRRADARKNASA